MEYIRQAFDEAASTYDAQRKYVIPGMEELYEAAVWAAQVDCEDPEVLDIGAGTGLLSALILERYPAALITLLDISDAMLNKARARFSGCRNVVFITGDYSHADLGGTYDLICSALSIHHLAREDKVRLFRRIYAALNPGGIFVNADQVLGESPRIQQQYVGYWDRFVEAGPLPREEAVEIRRRRDTLDQNEYLDVQLGWLRNCGFTELDIAYKNRMFVVYSGRKE